MCLAVQSVSPRPHIAGPSTPPNVAQSSMDSRLEDQAPLVPHLSTLASAQSLLNKRSSGGNARGSREAWEVWGSLPALRNPDILIQLLKKQPLEGS